METGYFFLVLACLAAMACCFCLSALLAWDVFCEDFFWFAFGDLSPMCLTFFSELTALRNRCFPAEAGTLLAARWIVNDGRVRARTDSESRGARQRLGLRALLRCFWSHR